MCCFEKKRGHRCGPGAGTDLRAAREGLSLSLLCFLTCRLRMVRPRRRKLTGFKATQARWSPTQGHRAAARDAADAKNLQGLRGRTDNSWDRKAPGANEYIEIPSALESLSARNTLGVGEHQRDVRAALLFPQALPFT